MLALEDKLKNMPNNLSGGQQQRVAIARALVAKPAIVLADEPTGNLDSKTSADVMGLIKRTSYEFHQTVVMITHNNEIARLADRIVRIEDGRNRGIRRWQAMTWPFENNTNGIVKNLAKRNLKSEKRRNVMVIVSVVLSAFLISLSGLTGVSLMQTERRK